MGDVRDRNQAVVGLLAMDRATMVVEEVFRNACYGYQVGDEGESE